MDMTRDVEAGQAVYTPATLALGYDLMVLGFSNRFAWKCPTAHILEHYNRHVSANHLDIGVGTGYYVAHCRYPVPAPRLALMDINEHSLRHAAHRARRYQPELYRRNVLEPIAFANAKFDSIGMTYLLHCLPGRMAQKAAVFDHIRPLMNPGAVIFGATIVSDTPRNAAARKLMDVYNAKGIFSNRDDTVPELEKALTARFARCSLDVKGCVAVFSAYA